MDKWPIQRLWIAILPAYANNPLKRPMGGSQRFIQLGRTPPVAGSEPFCPSEGRGSSLLIDPEDLASAYARLDAFALCRAFGWSYMELEATPSDVIDDFLYILTHHGQR